jgi:hypothetical protein
MPSDVAQLLSQTLEAELGLYGTRVHRANIRAETTFG